MAANRGGDILGVVGGMGPVASAEFLKTIYEYHHADVEQLAPSVILLSDPSFPDRTDELLAGASDVLLGKLVAALTTLRQAGANRIVICCMTIHHLLPRLPDDLQRCVISLPDVIFDKLAEAGGKHLMICSSGTRQLKLFEHHRRWGEVKDLILWPDESEQQKIHYEVIYQIKKNRDPREFLPFLESLLMKHKMESFIAGCSEVHLLAKCFAGPKANRNRYKVIDPLTIIAEGLAGESE
jgi:aspartate racemase